MIIPHKDLDSDTLRAVIEEYVTRDGTDYGARECGLETKVQQVLAQLDTGKLVLTYDADSQNCNIILKD